MIIILCQQKCSRPWYGPAAYVFLWPSGVEGAGRDGRPIVDKRPRAAGSTKLPPRVGGAVVGGRVGPPPRVNPVGGGWRPGPIALPPVVCGVARGGLVSLLVAVGPAAGRNGAGLGFGAGSTCSLPSCGVPPSGPPRKGGTEGGGARPGLVGVPDEGGCAIEGGALRGEGV